MVVAMSDPIQAYTCLPYGVSEDPASPHYSDQAHLYANHELKHLHMDKTTPPEDVEQELTFDIER